MSQLGMGVMINQLFGNNGVPEIWAKVKDQTIGAVALKDDALEFTMADGYRFKLYDDGQSCCESRWMHTDDDLPYFSGTTLLNVELKDGPVEEGEYGDAKESQFLVVTTSKGSFTMVNYNNHNGYYGGFYVKAEVL